MGEKFICDLSGLKKELIEELKKAREELKKEQEEKLELEKNKDEK